MTTTDGTLTTAYRYDRNGNLIEQRNKEITITYQYDKSNRMTEETRTENGKTLRYNALGMLHAKESKGSSTRTTLEELIAGKEESDGPDGDESHTTRYTYDLTQPYYEVLTETVDGAVTSYTYGLERLAAYTEETKTTYLYDGRGSVVKTLGEAINVKAYSPFGELLTEKTSGYGFNGEYYDDATGMLNLRARQYEPAQARFSQRDIEKGYVTLPLQLNRYAFVLNNPISYIDPSGKFVMTALIVGAVAGLVIGAAVGAIKNYNKQKAEQTQDPTKKINGWEVVRNNTTVDPGGGGSSARTANQIAAEAYKSAMVSKVGVSHGGHSGKIPNATPVPLPTPTVTPSANTKTSIATPGPVHPVEREVMKAVSDLGKESLVMTQHQKDVIYGERLKYDKLEKEGVRDREKQRQILEGACSLAILGKESANDWYSTPDDAAVASGKELLKRTERTKREYMTVITAHEELVYENGKYEIKKVYTYGYIYPGFHDNVIPSTVYESLVNAGTEFYVNHSHPLCTGHVNNQFSTGFGDQAVVDWLGATGIYLTEPSTGNVYLYKEGGESIFAINEQIKGDSGEIGNVGYQIIDEFDCRNSDLFKQMLP